MRRVARLGSALAVAGTLVLLPPAAADPASMAEIAGDAATAARLEAHQHARDRLTSVQLDVVTVTHVPPRRSVGRVVLHGLSAYYRVAEAGQEGERVLQESTVTADEQLTVNYASHTATRVDLARVRAANPAQRVPNSARDILDAFAQAAPGSVQYLGPVQRDGATLDHFRIVAALGDGQEGELLLWAHATDGLPRRVELRAPSGRLLLERLFVNVKVNAPVPEAVFTLHVPPDIPVLDLTDDYIARTAAGPVAGS